MTSKNTILEWIEERRIASNLKISPIKLKEIDAWCFSKENIAHKTNRFFSIIAVKSDSTNINPNCQPLISQPEIGILGYVFRKNLNDVEILLQAKTEPGNIKGTQIAPTVQATYSNYTQVHEGAPTKYLDFFLKNDKLVNEGTLQSEQGTRFLSKYNRNISVFINYDEFINLDDSNWKWFKISELTNLIDQDFLINTDSRSVLVCSDWNALTNNSIFGDNHRDNSFRSKLKKSLNQESNIEKNTCADHLRQLDLSRKKRAFNLEKILIPDLDEWELNDYQFSKKNVFSIKSFEVNVVGREVSRWSQPLIHSSHEGIVILYCQSINGILHFLCSHSIEIGFSEFVQFGPSIQLLYENDQLDPQLNIENSNVKLISEYKQSDEGGRFYKSIVHYQLKEILLDDPISVDLDRYSWMTLKQIKQLLGTKGNFTNEFRSVLSLILKFA